MVGWMDGWCSRLQYCKVMWMDDNLPKNYTNFWGVWMDDTQNIHIFGQYGWMDGWMVYPDAVLYSHVDG